MREYIERKVICENCHKQGDMCIPERCLTFYIPATDVAPVVHGEWIHCAERQPYGRKWLECSVCRSINSTKIKFKHCPDCGAKMDLETNDG